MAVELAERLQGIQPSATMAISARAEALIAAGEDILTLSLGEPDFETPDHIKAAAIKAIEAGFTRYTAVDGTPSLKHAIINKFRRDNQLSFSLDNILVSCGAKHSLYNLFSAVLNPGDEVIIFAPYWVSYPDMVKLMGAKPVFIQAGVEQKFKVTPEQLTNAITTKTRLIILNSPSNPTGVAYTTSEFQALGDVLLQHPKVVVVTDDIYEQTIWAKEPFANILMATPELLNRCVVVNSVSKTYAMTGWRIGYAAGPATLINAMKKIQSQSTSNPTSISQVAAEAALTGDQACAVAMTKAYKERHDYIVPELQKMPGVTCTPSDGTFYTFPSIEKLTQETCIKNDLELSNYLLKEAKIAVVPGSAFGMENYIRLSYATNLDKIKEAMQRMQEALTKLYK